MASVSRKEGFRYGFYVFAYWLALLAVGAGLVAAGWFLVRETGRIGAAPEEAVDALGGFVAFLGVLVFGAGQTGLVYKVVADGVGTGVARGVEDWSSVVVAAEEGTGTDAEQPERGERPAATSATPGPAAGEPSTAAGGQEPGPATGTAADDAEPTGSGTAVESGVADDPSGTGTGTGSEQSGGEPTSAPGVEPGTDDPDEGTAGRTTSESDGGGRVGPGDEDEAEAEDGFAAGGFEPARPASDETEDAGATDESRGGQDGTTGDGAPTEDATGAGEEPADVVSESEIAEELGFGSDAETGTTPGANADAHAEGTSDEEAGADASSGPVSDPVDEPSDDPLAPDSDFAPDDTATGTGDPAGDESAGEDPPADGDQGEGGADDGDSAWTTGEEQGESDGRDERGE